MKCRLQLESLSRADSAQGPVQICCHTGQHCVLARLLVLLHCIRDMRNAYTILVGVPEGNTSLGTAT